MNLYFVGDHVTWLQMVIMIKYLPCVLLWFHNFFIKTIVLSFPHRYFIGLARVGLDDFIEVEAMFDI